VGLVGYVATTFRMVERRPNAFPIFDLPSQFCPFDTLGVRPARQRGAAVAKRSRASGRGG